MTTRFFPVAKAALHCVHRGDSIPPCLLRQRPAAGVPSTVGVGLLLVVGLAIAGCKLVDAPQPSMRSQLACRQLTQQGLNAMDEGQWDEAADYLERAVQTCPVDVEAREHYAEALWKQGDYEQALAQLNAALQLSPGSPELLLQAAQCHFRRGQDEWAIRLVEAALDANPHLADAWALRGQLMKSAHRPAEALAAFQRALSYDPQRKQWLLEVAELYRQMNRPQQALANLQTLSDLYPPGQEPAQVLDLLGLAYAALGRYDEAIETYALALRRGGEQADVLFHQAEALWLAGRVGEAETSLRRALALHPQHEPSRQLLARIQSHVPANAPLMR